jgi:hypothetical protein
MALQSKSKRAETLEVGASPIQSHAADTSGNHARNPDEIKVRAYEIYLERGGLPGSDLDDWLQAERELTSAAPPKRNGFPIKLEAQ